MNSKFITEALKECLNRNSRPGFKLGDDLSSLFNSVKSDEKLLPVVGTQGMGKSTLINALLGEDILPNAADETTCVPVEVAYGEDERADVFFKNENRVVTVHTKEELNLYVDNNENPANSKNVEHIRLYRKSEILKDGLIIVDLPGVGSITSANQDTTERYLRNVKCGVFVIPTVPTIRRTESLFIRAAWSQFNSAIFVQNDFGETQQEKRDSVDFNSKLLGQIASDYSLTFEKPILVINALNALVGGIKKDSDKINKSGIKLLSSKISTMSAKWDANLDKSLKDRCKSIIVSALAEVNRKKQDASKAEEELRAEHQANFEKSKAEIEDILHLIDNIQDWAREQQIKAKRDISAEVSKTAGSIRAEVTKNIDKGIFDGDRLNEMFASVQTREVEFFSQKANDILFNVGVDFKEKLQDLYMEIEHQESFDYESVKHKADDPIHWEKGVNKAFNYGGAIVSVIGAKAVAIALISSNPAGWAIAVVGAAIYGLASLFGFGIRKATEAQRKEKAKKEIYPKIDEIELRLSGGINKKIDEFFDNATDMLDNIRKQKREELRVLKKSLRNPQSTIDNTCLESDYQILNNALQIINS